MKPNLILPFAAGLAILADLLFWNVFPVGASWPIYLLFLAAAIALVGDRFVLQERRVQVLAGLFLLACAQSANELSFTNIVSSLALLFILTGCLYYRPLESLWARTSE
jgi:hypothetical protein